MKDVLYGYADAVLSDIENLDEPIGMLEAAERLLDYADVIEPDKPDVAESVRSAAKDLLIEAMERAELVVRFARDVALMSQAKGDEE